MDLDWMAWTQPTVVFFCTIGGLITMMIVWEWFSPGGNPRLGALGLISTRGDRLFMSLLFSAILSLGWLGFVPLPLWWALPACVFLSVLIFRFC
jgi:predicted small integral membrane protein